MLLLVYCCNIEIKLLHIVLVLQCIEDIVDSSKHFSEVQFSGPFCTTDMFNENYPPDWNSEAQHLCLHLHLDEDIPDT